MSGAVKSWLCLDLTFIQYLKADQHDLNSCHCEKFANKTRLPSKHMKLKVFNLMSCEKTCFRAKQGPLIFQGRPANVCLYFATMCQEF